MNQFCNRQTLNRERERENTYYHCGNTLKCKTPFYTIIVVQSDFTSYIGWPRDGGDDVTL